MRNWTLAPLGLAALVAACDGGGGGGNNPYAPVSLKSVAGNSYVADGPQMSIRDGFTPASTVPANILFVSATQVNFNGLLLTKEADGLFWSADHTVSMKIDTALTKKETDQILYMMATQTSGLTTSVTPFVAGNTTALADIPHSGTGVYSGTMTLYDDLGNGFTSAGPTLFVDFVSATVDGGVTFAGTYVPIETPATVTNGNFAASLTTGGATPTVSGTMDGSYFGNAASEIGGTITITYAPTGTPSETYVGYYGAAKN